MTSHSIANELLAWYRTHKRDLPWRKTKDPYPVWISEVILQQTRVNQGLPYFHAFMENFPTVHDLANASEDLVLKTWEGLGYYSRARNLHAGAKYISLDRKGVFPNKYETLLKVKGIGPYTAAAIASICFGQATPVIDGNVYRVMARHVGIFDDIAKASSRKVFMRQLEKIIPHDFPGDFNQSIMELGATVCTPQAPDCLLCPINTSCYALTNKLQSILPVKSKKIKVKRRYFHYLVLEYGGRTAMKKREAGDIWQGLYDFPLEESQGVSEVPSFYEKLEKNATINVSGVYQHVLTHQKIFAYFHHVLLDSEKKLNKLIDDMHLEVFSWADIVALPKPRLIVNYLNEHDF